MAAFQQRGIIPTQPSASPADDATAPDAKAQATAEFWREFYERNADLTPYSRLCDAVAQKLYQAGGLETLSREERMQAFAIGARERIARQQAATPTHSDQPNAAARQEIARQQDPVAKLRADAEQGDPSSQFQLGWRYETGSGVEQDYAKAADWFQKAAEQGDPSAQNNLGVLFRDGVGVQKDTVQAYAMFWIAADAGCTNAALNRDRLSLTWDQWSDAMRRADSFKARYSHD